jgi:DNA helicase-2/ATP-dependent DNA helicase PcrA
MKLARILAEDVRVPRGVACITYSQECARELSRRLETLGLRDAPNLFVGTIHGFCLRHLLLPYAHLGGLNLPEPLTVATLQQTRESFRVAGERVLGHGQLPYKRDDVGRTAVSISTVRSPAGTPIRIWLSWLWLMRLNYATAA